MTESPPIPEELWNAAPLGALAALLRAFGRRSRQIAGIEERLKPSPTNPFRLPSTDPPA